MPLRRSYLTLLQVAVLDIILLGMMSYLMYGIRTGGISTAVEADVAIKNVIYVLGGATITFTLLGLFSYVVYRAAKD